MALSAVSLFLAQAAAPAAQTQGGIPPFMIVGYGLMFAAMYFFMIKPQRDKQKAHEKLLASLESGDELVTTGGLYGTITSVKDDRFVLRISENTKVEVAKSFVHAVVRKAGGDKK